jgi:hypothetical protein
VHLAIIGHTGKDVSRGMRGSNAALGDVDLMVVISGDIIRTATVTKANDAPEGPLFSFKSEVHEFGTDEDGDPITVNIVGSETVTETAVKRSETKLSINQRVMAPSAVNDSARAMMAVIRKHDDDISGAIVTGGASTAYTLSSFSAFNSLANMNGQPKRSEALKQTG